MDADDRFPAPWERPLSRIRDQARAELDAADPPDDHGASMTPTDDGADDAAQGPRRRRRVEGGDRLTVAELLARMEAEGQPPVSPARRRRTVGPQDPATPAAPGSPAESAKPDRPTATDPDPVVADDGAAGVAAAEPPRGDQAAPGPAAAAHPSESAPSAEPGDRPPPKAPPMQVDASGEPEPGPRRPAAWARRTGMTLVALVSVFAVVIIGAGWGYLRSTDGQYHQVAALDVHSSDIRDPDAQYGDENYLIVGTDSRAGDNSLLGAGTEEDAEGTRTDTIILVHVPSDRSRVVAVSFPRDLNVDRPACQGWDDETGTYTGQTYGAEYDVKLNGVFYNGGPRCLVKVIQKLSGLKINHFVGLDFVGFERMVDVVGGVEVCVSEPLVDEELGTILDQTGVQTLDGPTALDYVRARKVASEGASDYGRIHRQQMLLSSLMRTALSTDVLFDLGRLNRFINEFTQVAFGEGLDTESLLNLGRSLQNVEAGKVTFLTAPTAGTTEWGNEIPRTTDIKAIFDAIIDKQPLPGESGDHEEHAADAEEVELLALQPYEVTVQVSNASNVDGAASATATTLGAYGFGIYSIGDYTGPVQSTMVQFSGDNEAAAATVAAMIPGAQLQRTSGLGNIVEVVLGPEYGGTIVEPAPAGTPVSGSVAVDLESGEAAIPLDVSVLNAGENVCP